MTVNSQLSTVNWYAVHTKTRHEAVAVVSLQREGVETFYPRLRRKKAIRRVRKWVTGPLFPSYIFARFDVAKSSRLVKYANGVTNVVSFGGKPAAVEDSIIAEIQSHCRLTSAADSSDIVTIDPPSFQPGEVVEIQSGPLMGLQGIFEYELSDHERVVILLETLAKGARVEISRADLEKV